jgi:hypothetical protein
MLIPEDFFFFLAGSGPENFTWSGLFAERNGLIEACCKGLRVEALALSSLGGGIYGSVK